MRSGYNSNDSFYSGNLSLRKGVEEHWRGQLTSGLKIDMSVAVPQFEVVAKGSCASHQDSNVDL